MARLLAGAACVALTSLASSAFAEPPAGIAVVPFTGAGDSGFALRLAERLAAISSLRVVPPGRTEVAARLSPDAAEVRAWAERLAVDSVVLGRVESSGEAEIVYVDLRSGHSGGPVAEHHARIADAAGVERVASELADALLADLDVPHATPLPAVGAAAAIAGAAAIEVESPPSDDGPRGLFAVGSSDEPLSIDSDELELTESGDSRHLIFRRNVRVTQGDIELLTEELEAFYEAGSSQPERLVATGEVRVLQGERRARCDRAVYQRADQTVECTGHAELVQRCDRVRGPTIRFDLERDHVRVLGGASVVIAPDAADGSGCAEGGS